MIKGEDPMVRQSRRPLLALATAAVALAASGYAAAENLTLVNSPSRSSVPPPPKCKPHSTKPCKPKP
jgi:hypothetical protein